MQPSEFAKLAFVLALGRYLMYRENYRRLRGLLVPLALTTLPVLLVLKEPDLGTASVFLPVLFVMLLVAGARWGDLLRVLITGVLLLPLFWMQMRRSSGKRLPAVSFCGFTMPSNRIARKHRTTTWYCSAPMRSKATAAVGVCRLTSAMRAPLR